MVAEGKVFGLLVGGLDVRYGIVGLLMRLAVCVFGEVEDITQRISEREDLENKVFQEKGRPHKNFHKTHHLSRLPTPPSFRRFLFPFHIHQMP